MKRVWIMALALGVLTACGDDGEEGVQLPRKAVVGFEQAQLEGGLLTGSDRAEEITDGDETYRFYYGPLYEESAASVWTLYSTRGGTSFTGGFVLSNKTNTVDGSYANRYSVYADGGAAGSTVFAVGHYDAARAGEGVPRILFSEPVNPLSVYINNTTYVYRWWTAEGPDGEPLRQLADCTLTIAGYNGTERRELNVSLTSAKGQAILSGWTSVNLSSLGWVDRLEFRIHCDEADAPLYFCLDNLAFAMR